MTLIDNILIIIAISINAFLFINHLLRIRKIRKFIHHLGNKILGNISQDIYTYNNFTIILNYQKSFSIVHHLVESPPDTIIVCGDAGIDWMALSIGEKEPWCKYLDKSRRYKNVYGLADRGLIELSMNYGLKKLYIGYLGKYNFYAEGLISRMPDGEFLMKIFENVERIKKMKITDRMIKVKEKVIEKVKRDEEVILMKKRMEDEDSKDKKVKIKYLNKRR